MREVKKYIVHALYLDYDKPQCEPFETRIVYATEYDALAQAARELAEAVIGDSHSFYIDKKITLDKAQRLLAALPKVEPVKETADQENVRHFGVHLEHRDGE